MAIADPDVLPISVMDTRIRITVLSLIGIWPGTKRPSTQANMSKPFFETNNPIKYLDKHLK